MDSNMHNLVYISDIIFSTIEKKVKGKNMVLIIGTTGDGKSTMM